MKSETFFTGTILFLTIYDAIDDSKLIEKLSAYFYLNEFSDSN